MGVKPEDIERAIASGNRVLAQLKKVCPDYEDRSPSKFSESHRRRMSEAQRLRAAMPGESERRSKKTKEWIDKHGHPKGFKGHHRTEQEKRKISLAVLKMWGNPDHVVNSDEHRQKLSDHFSKIASRRNPSNAFSRTKKGLRSDIGISCRSSWEANYARYLNWTISNDPRTQFVSWEYEKETFWFESIKRGCRSWKPDFKVHLKNGTVEYHEVKGWMYPRAITALRRMRIYHPSISIVLIDESRYKALDKTVGKFIPHWEHRS